MAAVSSYGGVTPRILLGLIWTAVAVAIAFTLIRTRIRLYVYGRLFADDIAVYIAVVLLVIIAIMYQVITPTMFIIDQVASTLSPGMVPPPNFMEEATIFLKIQFAIIILFWTTLWAVKFSFLLYYKNIFAGLPNHLFWWRIVCGLVLFAYLGCWATQLAACSPIVNYFSLGACESKRDIWVSNFSLYYTTAVDIFCDILVMALPLRLLWNLQVNRQQKWALATIFSLGFIIIIFAIVRVIETRASAHHVDPVWLALWSMIEASVAIVVSCLPSFRVLLRTNRSDSAYNRRNNSGSRSRSRSRRPSKHVWRLKSITRGGTSFGSSGHGGKDSLPTENRAGAESADSYGTDLEYGEAPRADGSKEYILPKLSKVSVHIKRDVKVDYSRK